jgi:hypothetical protein
MKKILAIIAAIALCLPAGLSASAETWVLPPAVPGQVGLTFEESGQSRGAHASYLQASKVVDGKRKVIKCASYGLAECGQDPTWEISANLLLPTCIGQEVNCIEGLEIYKPGQAVTSATFQRQVPGPQTPGFADVGLPRGSSVGIWHASDQLETDPDGKYAAWAKLVVMVRKGKTSVVSFTGGVSPVVETTGQFFAEPTTEVRVQDINGEESMTITGGGPNCVYTYTGICATARPFAENTRVAMNLRISNDLTGWLKGRLKDPVITLNPIDKTINNLKIDAEPANVPGVVKFFDKGEATVELKKKYTSLAFQETAANFRAMTTFYQNDNLQGMELVNDLRPLVNDTASGINTIWSFASIINKPWKAGLCTADKTKLLGLITTNALAYEGEAPAFQSGFLNYKVAGMHFAPDGKTELQGTYDLVMRSDVARCIYGFSKAPISATISVAGGTDKTVATTVVSEKNGWLKLAAYGFTFSDKTIKVKLSQPKVVKKATITCVKGKVTKKVTAIGPKCPAGFKKK